eukprot:g16383.t1
MSGERDPVNYSLPQPPLLHSLFPSARTFTSFNTSTNPALLDVDGVRMLGSSGQPLSDLMSYSSASSLTAHLEKTLRWRNIAPTAPDTLACYPFKAGQNDPFIIDATPHVYFAANQDRFESRLLKAKSSKQEVTVCLLAVPSFSKTQTIALVDLDTLRAHPVNFSVRAAVTPEGQAQPPQPTPSHYKSFLIKSVCVKKIFTFLPCSPLIMINCTSIIISISICPDDDRNTKISLPLFPPATQTLALFLPGPAEALIRLYSDKLAVPLRNSARATPPATLRNVGLAVTKN